MTYWGRAPDCTALTTTQDANGNPCIKLRTKNANELGAALGLKSAQVAALPFKSGDLAIVVTDGYPWDLKMARTEAG